MDKIKITRALLDSYRKMVREINLLEKELEDMLVRAREMIDLIRDDETAWQILWERYIIGETWSAIARKMNYGRATVIRLASAGVGAINEKLIHCETS